MSGEGCSYIYRWDLLAQSLPSIGGELRRVDVALDFFDGEVLHDDVLSAYDRGLFKKPHVGRSPKMKKVETSCPTDGRTIYIGARTSSRFIRCYEKGWERLAKTKVPESFKTASNRFYFRRNIPSSAADYYRLEVELKAVDGFFIPLDILTNPDSFFAGAAPYFESLVQSAPSRLVQPPSDFLQVQTLQSSMEHCSRAYGGLLRSLLELYGDSVESRVLIFDALCSQNPSDSLVRAGCLSLPVVAEQGGTRWEGALPPTPSQRN